MTQIELEKMRLFPDLPIGNLEAFSSIFDVDQSTIRDFDVDPTGSIQLHIFFLILTKLKIVVLKRFYEIQFVELCFSF